MGRRARGRLRSLSSQTLDELGGAEAIVGDHLERALAGLQPEQKDVAASIFDHLVTPSGTKIAHRAADLAEYADVDEADLGSVLELSGTSVSCGGGGRDGGPRFEIFHDVLADAVLAWRERQPSASARRRSASTGACSSSPSRP